MKLATLIDGIGERFALLLVAGVWVVTLVVVAILGERVNADSLAALRTTGGKEVKEMQPSYVLALALCVSCAAGDPAGGSSLLPAMDAAAGSRTPVPVADVDAGALPADAPPALADAVVAADQTAAPEDRVALPPDAPPATAYQSCVSLGYPSAMSRECPAPSRTPDQRYSCGVCGAMPPAQTCVSVTVEPGDLPWLCVHNCAECVRIQCTKACCPGGPGAPPCPVLVDGGAH